MSGKRRRFYRWPNSLAANNGSPLRTGSTSPGHALSWVVVRHRHPGAADGAGVTAKFRDGSVVHGDADVIDAGAAVARDFARGGDQPIAELARLDEGDAALC